MKEQNNNINLTKMFVRFLKEENVWNDFKQQFTKRYYFYDGVFDNINLRRKKFLHQTNISMVIEEIMPNNKITLFKLKWSKFKKKHKAQYEITPNNQYFNIATPIIKNFLIENNALQEVTRVLHKKGLIKIQKIQDNDLDEILRNNDVPISSFFLNVKTFCIWESSRKYQPKHITWQNLNENFKQYINNYKSANLVP